MQRRQCLRRLAHGAGGLQLMAWGAAAMPVLARGAATSWQESRVLMGTRVDLSVSAVPAALARVAMARAWDRMAALAAMMSRFEAGNPLDQLASLAGRGQVLPVPRELAAVLQAALQRAQDSGGRYDPTVGSYQGWDFRPGMAQRPHDIERQSQRHLSSWRHLKLDLRQQQASLDRAGVRLDLGGAAKLPILEAGLEALRSEGIRHALINGGGDILSLGQAEAGRPWRVALRDPREPARWLGVLDLPSDSAVLAASGDYERCFEYQGRRFHHILDPRSGEPSQGLRGLALLGRSVAALNAWGPAMMVAGPGLSRRWAHGLQGVELMLAGPGEGQGSQQLWMSPGLERQLLRS